MRSFDFVPTTLPDTCIGDRAESLADPDAGVGLLECAWADASAMPFVQPLAFDDDEDEDDEDDEDLLGDDDDLDIGDEDEEELFDDEDDVDFDDDEDEDLDDEEEDDEE